MTLRISASSLARSSITDFSFLKELLFCRCEFQALHCHEFLPVGWNYRIRIVDYPTLPLLVRHGTNLGCPLGSPGTLYPCRELIYQLHFPFGCSLSRKGLNERIPLRREGLDVAAFLPNAAQQVTHLVDGRRLIGRSLFRTSASFSRAHATSTWAIRALSAFETSSNQVNDCWAEVCPGLILTAPSPLRSIACARWVTSGHTSKASPCALLTAVRLLFIH